MNEKINVKIGNQEVIIDPTHLEFNEATLNEYIKTEGAKYNYYSQMLADAQAQWQIAKLHYDSLCSERFNYYKSQVGKYSDKVCEHKVAAEEDVLKAGKKVIACQRIVDQLKGYLRSWDKNHDNAMSLGHMLRKEMDKLGFDIKTSQQDKLNEVFG